MKTPSNMNIPKLESGMLETVEGDKKIAETTRNADKDKKDVDKKDKKRQLSDSSRGSIGRRQRLRNALTGRSDGSGDGVDQPKDLPEHEQIDFLLQYDKTDPFCHKIVIKKVERDDLDVSDEEDGDIGIEDNLSNGPDFDNIETRQRAEGDVSQELKTSQSID